MKKEGSSYVAALHLCCVESDCRWNEGPALAAPSYTVDAEVQQVRRVVHDWRQLGQHPPPLWSLYTFSQLTLKESPPPCLPVYIAGLQPLNAWWTCNTQLVTYSRPVLCLQMVKAAAADVGVQWGRGASAVHWCYQCSKSTPTPKDLSEVWIHLSYPLVV